MKVNILIVPRFLCFNLAHFIVQMKRTMTQALLYRFRTLQKALVSLPTDSLRRCLYERNHIRQYNHPRKPRGGGGPRRPSKRCPSKRCSPERLALKLLRRETKPSSGSNTKSPPLPPGAEDDPAGPFPLPLKSSSHSSELLKPPSPPRRPPRLS